jgi:plastocyanin
MLACSPVLSRFARLSPLIAVSTLALGLGCGRSHGSHQVFVTMADNVFSPREIRVPVGARIHFRNMGGTIHDAVAVDGSWSTRGPSGESMGIGKWVELAFDRPGVHPFYCPYHATKDGAQGMVGTVVVGDVEYVPGGKRSGQVAVVDQPSGVTRRVPAEYPTIQSAVDATGPGDLVLVDDGVYQEEVYVTTPSLTIRGTDRNRVVLDGEFQRANGFLIFADAVAIENLTARNYTLNGFLWSGVTGYRGSYLSAINNGDYGIYAFDSYDGVLDHSLGSGSPDAGFYIGGCYPCKAVLDQVVAERNGGGYSGTNSGGDLLIVNSVFRDNAGSGVSPNTFDVEPMPPARETSIIGNVIVRNGTGVSIAGGSKNRVERNLIEGNRTGIMLLAVKDQRYYPSTGNVIRDNVILRSRRVDIAMSGLGNIGNCFAGNVHRSTLPWGLELLQGCDGLRAPVVGDPRAYFAGLAGRVALFNSPRTPATTTEWRTVPHPAPQPSLPRGADAPVVPAVKPFARYDVDVEAIRAPIAAPPRQIAARGGGGLD